MTLRCTLCETAFADADSLESHSKRLHTKKCGECHLCFRTAVELEEHVQSAHDVFGDDEAARAQQVRLTEDGGFALSGDHSYRRFIHGISRKRQRARIEHQVQRMTTTVEHNPFADGHGKGLSFI